MVKVSYEGSKLQKALNKKGTYNVKTKTYTDSSGQKQSMKASDAVKAGATIVFSGGGSSGGGSSGGGSSRNTKNIPLLPPTINKFQPTSQVSQEQIEKKLQESLKKRELNLAQEQAKLMEEARRIKNWRGYAKRPQIEKFNKNINKYQQKVDSFNETVQTIQLTNAKIAGEQLKKQYDFITQIRLGELELSKRIILGYKNDRYFENTKEKIYKDLEKINNKYGSRELTEKQLENYRKELAPIIARYNFYSKDRQNYLKRKPDNKLKANLEYNPGLGKNVLILDSKDRSISNLINNLAQKATTKIQRGNGGVSTIILTGATLSKLGLDFIKGTIELPKTVYNVIKNPSLLTQVPTAIKESGKSMGQLINISPTAGLVKLGAEVYFWTKVPGDAIKLVRWVRVQASRLSPYFRGVETTSLGVQSIKNVNKVGDIEIILNRGSKLKTDPLKVIKEADLTSRLKKVPKLAPTTKIEKEFLDVVSKRGDTVTGSYAGETLLKNKYTRKHKDLDIASSNIPALINALKRKFGKRISFTTKPNSVLVKINGKEIADLVPIAKAEAGLIKKFGIKKVGGLKLADPRAIIGGKATKLGSTKVPRSLSKSLAGKATQKSRMKTVKDIEKLTGQKALDRPALTGAFGFTKKTMKKYLGKEGPLTTAQADFLVKTLLKRNPTLKNNRWLYATPWEIKTGKAQVRVSRLGLVKEEGTILDLLRGEASLKRSGKPQIFVLPKQRIFSPGTKLTKGKTINTPDGFVVPNFSSELEVVLGGGYILKRGEKLAQAIIGGEIVPITELKKIKMPSMLKKEFNNYLTLNKKLEKLVKTKPKTPADIKKNILERNKLIKKIDMRERSLGVKFKKKTGFDYFSPNLKPKKFYPIGKRAFSGVVKLSRLPRGTRKLSKKIIRKTTRKTSPRRTPRKTTLRPRPTPRRPTPRRPTPRRPTPRRPTPRRPNPRRPTPRRPTTRPRARPKPRPTPKKPPIVPRISQFKKKTLSKKQPTYYVVMKRRGKLIKLAPKPFILKDAKDYLAYRVDRGLSRQAFYVSSGKEKKVYGLPKPIQGYYSKNQKKLRPYKIRMGKKKQLLQGYIEKRKYALDTPSEKAQIKYERKRKITPKQRKQLIQRLKKARAVRMKNLKKRK